MQGRGAASAAAIPPVFYKARCLDLFSIDVEFFSETKKPLPVKAAAFLQGERVVERSELHFESDRCVVALKLQFA